MSEGRNFSVLLLSGGFSQWTNAITPLLKEQTDRLLITESADELLSLQATDPAEMFVITHAPGVHDGIAAARRIREVSLLTPLVLLAFENLDTLKYALEVGAVSILEPPFSEDAVADAFKRCRRLAGALKGEALKLQSEKPASILNFPEMPESAFSSTWQESTPNASANVTEPPGLQTSLSSGHKPAAPETPASIDAATAADEHRAEFLSSLKILVSEDLPMLQIGIKHALETIGCQYVIVENGKEVLDELEKGAFDAILMDLRMPVMDGYTATRMIREKEMITGERIPIVALSSYSLKDIQDKCFEIGMDDYLFKPVDRKKLEDTLFGLKNPRALSEQSKSITSGLDGLPVLDPQAVLENIDFDLKFYWELIDTYLETYSGLGEELAKMLAEDDLEKILNSAHGLKGLAANIGGRRLAEVACQIQNLCQEGKKPVPNVWAPIVKAESGLLIAAMETITWDDLRMFAADSTP